MFCAKYKTPRFVRENLAVLRHIALSRLKQDDAKFRLRNKRNTTGWDDRYLAKLLFASSPGHHLPDPAQ